MSQENATPAPIQRPGQVVMNRPVARDTFRLRVRSPEIAASILPGQFVMLRVPGRTDPLLARPFALYDTAADASGRTTCIDVVYLVQGAGTRAMQTLKAEDAVDLWGPLGNTFPTQAPNELREHLFVAAGGIGQTPFPAILQELLGQRRYGAGREAPRPRRITFAWGVRTASYFGELDDFALPGVELQLATDDGSRGRRGFVTDLLDDALAADDPPTAVFGCGPLPMLARLAAVARAAKAPCWVSLEEKMACGYGVCFSCVCPMKEAAGWDYRRTCIDGPIFPGDAIAWEVCAADQLKTA